MEQSHFDECLVLISDNLDLLNAIVKLLLLENTYSKVLCNSISCPAQAFLP